MNPSIVILGGGLTGLGCARHRPGSVIYEAKAHPGGHVFSHERGAFHFDEGAHICHAKDEAWKAMLFASAGEVVTTPQSQVANWWHGHWVTYPVQNHLRDLPVADRIRALTEIVAAQATPPAEPPRNYEQWCLAQYGEFLTERFYREYTDKYWRTPMADMDIDWLSGRLLPSQLERIVHGAIAPLDEKQSVFSSFHYPARGGFFAFFKALYDGIPVELNAEVREVDPVRRTVRFADGRSVTYDKLLSTIPLNTLVASIRGVDVPDAVARAAASLRHTRLLGVNLVVNRPCPVPYHWFYIYDREIEVSRVKVVSNVLPGSSPPDTMVLQTEIFRRDDEPWDIDELTAKTVQELAPLLGYDPARDVANVSILTASHAYPIPMLGRNEAVATITGWLDGLGIHTAGLCGRWKYVWSDQAYAAGKAAAEAMG